jgi:hypothetical protein
MTWDLPYLRFYVDGELVSTLGRGSYISPYSEIVTHINEESYSITANEIKIIEIKFTTETFWSIFQGELLISGDGEAAFRYVLNGTTIGFNPVDTLATGSHIVNLFLPITPVIG